MFIHLCLAPAEVSVRLLPSSCLRKPFQINQCGKIKTLVIGVALSSGQKTVCRLKAYHKTGMANCVGTEVQELNVSCVRIR